MDRAFKLAEPPYPEHYLRVNVILGKFRAHCARRMANVQDTARFRPRLSAYERNYIGFSEESATVLAKRYGVSANYIHQLRARARGERT